MVVFSRYGRVGRVTLDVINGMSVTQSVSRWHIAILVTFTSVLEVQAREIFVLHDTMVWRRPPLIFDLSSPCGAVFFATRCSRSGRALL